MNETTLTHTKDSDCVLDENGACVHCHVIHGDPCARCEGRGYHALDCPETFDPSTIKVEDEAHYRRLTEKPEARSLQEIAGALRERMEALDNIYPESGIASFEPLLNELDRAISVAQLKASTDARNGWAK